MKVKKVIGSSQHGILREKSCLTNLIAFLNEVAGLVMKGEQWMFIFILARLMTMSLITSSLTK